MSKIKTTEEVIERVQIEDLGYAVQYYYGKDLNSEDPALNELWTEAYISLTSLDEYLERLEHSLE